MRTTVVLDDALFREAKQRAAATGVTLSELLNRALAAILRPSTPAAQPAFRMPTFGRGEEAVHHEPADFKAAEEEEDFSRARRR